jgi:hypothetical protein
LTTVSGLHAADELGQVSVNLRVLEQHATFFPSIGEGKDMVAAAYAIRR